MANPIRLPLTQRQAEAVQKALEEAGDDLTGLSYDELAAVREVAEKLSTLREGR